MGWRGPGDLLDTVITQAQPDTPGAYMSLIIDESTVRPTLLQLGILDPLRKKRGVLSLITMCVRITFHFG